MPCDFSHLASDGRELDPRESSNGFHRDPPGLLGRHQPQSHADRRRPASLRASSVIVDESEVRSIPTATAAPRRRATPSGPRPRPTSGEERWNAACRRDPSPERAQEARLHAGPETRRETGPNVPRPRQTAGPQRPSRSSSASLRVRPRWFPWCRSHSGFVDDGADARPAARNGVRHLRATFVDVRRATAPGYRASTTCTSLGAS